MKEVAEKLVRVSDEYLDEILGVAFPVLDKGFIRVTNYMGNESSICQSARVAYGKGTKSISEDSGLIRYLMRHWHTTPFEMCQIQFHVRVPMDCWRQWIRHRMSSTNEYSTRYSEAIDDKQETRSTEWRLQSTVNKQGSGNFLEPQAGAALSSLETEFHAKAVELYQQRLDAGVAKEQARKDLPLSTYTEAYWNIDLHNLLHFLSLRMDSHAQLEIRSYANQIGMIVSRWLPNVWEAFNDYHPRRNTLVFTAREKKILELILQGVVHPLSEEKACDIGHDIKEAMGEWGWLDYDTKTNKLKNNRERAEFEVKLDNLGLHYYWKGDRK